MTIAHAKSIYATPSSLHTDNLRYGQTHAQATSGMSPFGLQDAPVQLRNFCRPPLCTLWGYTVGRRCWGRGGAVARGFSGGYDANTIAGGDEGAELCRGCAELCRGCAPPPPPLPPVRIVHGTVWGLHPVTAPRPQPPPPLQHPLSSETGHSPGAPHALRVRPQRPGPRLKGAAPPPLHPDTGRPPKRRVTRCIPSASTSKRRPLTPKAPAVERHSPTAPAPQPPPPPPQTTAAAEARGRGDEGPHTL